MMPDNPGQPNRACARCSRPADLVTPEGTLCSGHALAMSGSDGDWIPLIRKDTIPGREVSSGRTRDG